MEYGSKMGTRLYVGNLPYSTDDNVLESVFSKSGAVESATVITYRRSGRSKGFGFVEMATESDAEAAIEKLDGSELEGRPLRVAIAKPQPEHGAESNGAAPTAPKEAAQKSANA